MDAETDLKSASRRLNSMLISKGLLDGKDNLNFHGGSDARSIINFIYSIVQKSGKDAEQKENLVNTLREQKATETRTKKAMEALEAQVDTLERQLNVISVQRESLKTTIKTLEIQNKGLHEDLARQKTSLQQIRAQDAVERRKRDQQILRMKEKAGFDVRRTKTMSVATGKFTSSTWSSESTSSVTQFSENPESVLVFRETAANVIPDLMQELTDENARLIALIRETALMLNVFTGEKAVSDAEFESVLEYIPTTFPELSIEVNNSLEQLRELLHEPKYVSLEVVDQKDQEIERLKKQLAEMTKNWRDAIQMMDEWNQLMEKNMGYSPMKRQLESASAAAAVGSEGEAQTESTELPAPAVIESDAKTEPVKEYQNETLPAPSTDFDTKKADSPVKARIPQKRTLPGLSNSRIPALSQIPSLKSRAKIPLAKPERKTSPPTAENVYVAESVMTPPPPQQPSEPVLAAAVATPVAIEKVEQMESASPSVDMQSPSKDAGLPKEVSPTKDLPVEDRTPSRYPWSMLTEITNRAVSQSPAAVAVKESLQSPKPMTPVKKAEGAYFSSPFRSPVLDTEISGEKSAHPTPKATALMTPRAVVSASTSPARHTPYAGFTPAPANHDEDEELAAALRIESPPKSTPHPLSSKRPTIKPVSTLGPARRRTLPKSIAQLSSSPMGFSPIKLSDVDRTVGLGISSRPPTTLKRSRNDIDDGDDELDLLSFSPAKLPDVKKFKWGE
ncbi:Afadin and alpha-actinin-binding-domain-containing protein [Myxozyma melibiosi]|uniref:Afadin and alpha-actinin-binding-domain-containing protein n=1 Tax=Myxozyma melibiosi TaxID=54550 RepID=A0ABR1FEY0_9ASCO